MLKLTKFEEIFLTLPLSVVIEQRIEKGKERNLRNEEMGNMIVLLKPILFLERWFQIKVFEEQLLI